MKNTIKRRFFFHYRKQDGMMSVHWKKQCIPCQNINCRVEIETKRNKKQPYLVMQGFAANVEFENENTIAIW